MNDSGGDDWLQEESDFHNGIIAAFKSGTAVRSIDGYTHYVPCPLCQRRVDIVKRERRQNFSGGWEEPCIQYACDHCGYGGECDI